MTGQGNNRLENMTAQTPWKAIVLFSVPILMGNLFQQLYSMADAVIVGRLVGILPLAGVGATGAMNFLVIGFATGMTGGFSVVTAQRAGMKDEEHVKASVAASLCLCLMISAVLTAVSVTAAGPLLRLMNTPEDIFPYALGYIRIIFGGLGATIYYNLLAGMLRAIGDSRTPLIFLILSSILNIVLDLAAVLWFRLGVEGAALATVLAQLLSALACHGYAVRTYPCLRPSWRHFVSFRREARAHLRIGVPMALQFSVTAVGIMILQSYLNQFGSLVIAGYTAAGKVENLVTQPFVALALTMEVYCGQNYGAGKPERIRRGIKSGLAAGLVCAVLGAGLNLLLGRQMIGLFMEEYDWQVVEYGYHYLVVISVCFGLLSALQILRSALQGMGEALVPMAGGVAELLARWAGCALLAAPAGYVGVYLSTPLAWGLALLLLILRFASIAGACSKEAEQTCEHYAEEGGT